MAAVGSGVCVLPIELICLVIEHTDDLTTLENWCIATALSLQLHQVALRRRWRNVTITHKDFISEFEDLDEPLYGSLVRRGSRLRTLNGNPIHAVPTSYIKNLVLCFLWGVSGHCDERYALRPEELPFADDIQYSLSTLLPQCLSIEELCHDGVLHQGGLEEIAKLTTLKTLRLRETRYLFSAPRRFSTPPGGNTRPTDYSFETGLPGFRSLGFENLMQLEHLRCLEVSQVWRFEGKGLAQAVGRLKNLETLLLIAGTKREHIGRISALCDFLDHILSDTSGCLLSKSLRTLALSDLGGRRFHLRRRPPRTNKSLLPLLSNLYLNFDTGLAWRDLAEWIDLPALRRLYVPGIIIAPRFDAQDDYLPFIPVESINSFIKTHLNSLKEVILLNAMQYFDPSYGTSEMFPTRTAMDWEAPFVRRELVLANRPSHQRVVGDLLELPPVFAGAQDWTSGSRAYNRAYNRMLDYGHSEHTLVRLRIDQVDFDEDLVDILFSELEFSELKVLLLYPWPKTEDSAASRHNLPTDLTSFVEGRLALQIAARKMPRLPSVQVLIIGGFKFWVDREPSPKNKDLCLAPPLSNVQIYHFGIASEDERLKTSVKAGLSDRDLAFMDGLPDHPMKQGSNSARATEDGNCNYLFKAKPSAQMFKHGNYTVLQRGTPLGELSPPDPVIKRLTDRVIFNYMGD